MTKKIFGFILPGILGLATAVVLLPPQAASAAVECLPGTVVANDQGRVAQCKLARTWRFAQRMFPQNKQSTKEFECVGEKLIYFHPTGAIASCTLNNPISIIRGNVQDQCPTGRTISFTDKGLLALPNWCGKP